MDSGWWSAMDICRSGRWSVEWGRSRFVNHGSAIGKGVALPVRFFSSINRGKGAKDRYILFPASFRLVLKSHLHAASRNRYLFETRRFGPFTTRRIQQIVQAYRETAGITQPLHPHLFRHQMLTYLTSKGLTDAQIQLISGHQSKKSLEIYQHLSLQSVEKAYQEAVLNAAI
jgi:integrase/recombinase XerD